jgi:hypothetical protein
LEELRPSTFHPTQHPTIGRYWYVFYVTPKYCTKITKVMKKTPSIFNLDRVEIPLLPLMDLAQLGTEYA